MSISRAMSTALRLCGGKIREPVRFLGLARDTLEAKIEKYALDA